MLIAHRCECGRRHSSQCVSSSLADHEFLNIPKLAEKGDTRAVCSRDGGGVVGWNYLMTLSPLSQAMLRARAYAAVGIPFSRPRPKLLNVMIVDRAGQNRKFLNEVCV